MAGPKKINKDFFKKWSSDMAYVLGIFMADGNMVLTKRNNHYISFYSADKDILIEIKNALGSGHKLSKRNHDESFRIQIGNKEMFNDLCFLGVTPNKSKRMKMPEIPNKFVDDFVRGYFDGDGNVWSGYMNKSRAKPTHALQVAFTSSCMEFLHELLSLLRKRGVHGGSIFKIKNKECHRLIFGTSDALKLYQIMYNEPYSLGLKRKIQVFEKFIKMRS